MDQAIVDQIHFPQDAVAIPFEDNLVIVREGVNGLFLLNPTGAFLWELLASNHLVTQACSEVAEAYGISLEMATHDVAVAIQDWKSRGLTSKEIQCFKDPHFPTPKNHNLTPKSYSNLPEPKFYSERWYDFQGKYLHLRFENAQIETDIHSRYINLETHPKESASASIDAIKDDEQFLLMVDGSEVARSRTSVGLGYCLLGHFLEMTYPELDLMAWLHAGAVGNDSGTLALIGWEKSGKSTLTAALTHSGLQCYGDDRVFLNFPNAAPLKIPNSAAIKRGSWSVLESRFPEIHSLPIVCVDDEEIRFLPMPRPTLNHTSAPVSVLVFPKYKPDVENNLVPISSTQALMNITEAYSWISSEPAKAQKFLDWVKSIPSYQLSFSSLDQAVSQLRELLEP